MEYDEEEFLEEDNTELIDGEFYSQEEKDRSLVYRAINTIEEKFAEDLRLGKISRSAFANVKYYCRDLRAYNLLAELDLTRKEQTNSNE